MFFSIVLMLMYYLEQVVKFFISNFIRYFTILHGTSTFYIYVGFIIVVFLHFVFTLQLLQYGPHFVLKVGVHFAPPKGKLK